MWAMTQTTHAPEPSTWVPDDSTLGARLALLRQAMRWNVTEAARECNVNPESWRLWEEGRKPRDLVEVAKAISKRTGCDINWLVWGPSRSTLLRRAEHATSGYGRRSIVDLVKLLATVPAQRMPQEPRIGPATRPVEQTRPLRRQRPPVPLPAMS